MMKLTMIRLFTGRSQTNADNPKQETDVMGAEQAQEASIREAGIQIRHNAMEAGKRKAPKDKPAMC